MPTRGRGASIRSGGGSDAPCWSFYPVVAQTATALTLQYDWNGDGVITTVGKVNDPINCPTGMAACRGEQVTYSLSGTTLMRQEVGVDAEPSAGRDGHQRADLYLSEGRQLDGDHSRGRFGAFRS